MSKVIDFPGQQEPVEPTEAMNMVKKLETELHEGVEKLETQLNRLSDMKQAGRSTEDLVDELTDGLNATLVALDALTKFHEMIKQDLIGMSMNLENQTQGVYSTSLHLEALLGTLLEKGTVTDNEMKAAFQQAQARMQEQLMKAQESFNQDPSQ